jgi:anion-transporting  ArsA/GET3 family ATPase
MSVGGSPGGRGRGRAAGRPQPIPGLFDPGILIVSGKGGTGKTTVAAALASVAASSGLRVLLAEVEGRSELARVLSVPDPGYRIVPTPFGFDITSITPMEAALDYLHRYYAMDRISRPLFRSGGLEQVVRGAPGFRDLLIAGKVYELARARTGDPDATDPLHDLVIVDAPPTGQLGSFLSAPETFAELIRMGPMKRRAANVATMFRTGSRVLLVAIPEEMAVAETLESIPSIVAADVRLAGVVMNRITPAVLPGEAARVAGTLSPADVVARAAAAGLRLEHAEAAQLLRSADEGVRRRRRDRRFVGSIRTGLGSPIELPDISDVPPGERPALLAMAIRGERVRPEIVRLPYRPEKTEAPPRTTPLDEPLRGARIVVVCGSGGVGKTSVSAAIAIHAAEAGLRTVLLTVDPARRLSTALRLPRLAGERTTIRLGGGRSLDALQLDTKRTFDELVGRFAPDDAQRDRILTNPFYRRIADTLGGTHEYMAMEKLYELAQDEDHDVLVVDTPPTRSALSFLDAPKRLTDFLGGRFLRLMLWPTVTAGKITLSAARFGARTVLRTAGRLVGAETLADTVEFLAAFEGMYAGFKARADAVVRLLGSPGCAFVVVAAPTPASLAEAGAFVDRLDEGAMRTAAVILNRWHPAAPAPPAGTPRAVAKLAKGDATDRAIAALLRFGLRGAARRSLEGREVALFMEAHRRVELAAVPELEGDVHDIAGLRRIAGYAFGPGIGSGAVARAPAGTLFGASAEPSTEPQHLPRPGRVPY